MPNNGHVYVIFCIDVTFEMITVLSRNSFIQLISWKWMPGFFISNGKKGKESKIEERQRERVCVRGSMLQQEKDNVGNKTEC